MVGVVETTVRGRPSLVDVGVGVDVDVRGMDVVDDTARVIEEAVVGVRVEVMEAGVEVVLFAGESVDSGIELVYCLVLLSFDIQIQREHPTYDISKTSSVHWDWNQNICIHSILFVSVFTLLLIDFFAYCFIAL
jgi:hypothetical protein